MKRVMTISAVSMALMLGSLQLQANDALATIKGEAVAKAKVEETRLKDQFEAKQEVKAFKKESMEDKAKVVTQKYKDSVVGEEEKALKDSSSVKGEAAAKAKVEETKSKDKFEAKQKIEAFKNEAKSDMKKNIH